MMPFVTAFECELAALILDTALETDRDADRLLPAAAADFGRFFIHFLRT